MVWRRVLLRSDQSIADLHYTIQLAMGWSDSHLHRFHIHGKDYGVAHEGGIMFDDNPEKIRLGDFQFRPRERFLYEYDMYDSWEHDVRLEKVLPWNPGRIYPVCNGGQRPAPPEDCGGARAYMEDGDPRWRQWWQAMPREELALMAETMQHLLDTGSTQPIVENRERLVAAMERVKAHRACQPDRLDRREINHRLAQYARGDRDWLFCETIGG
jgi:Plasmid pRiA4b ORF-3-like protein